MKEPNIMQKNGIQCSENFYNYRNGSFINKNGDEVFLGHRLKDFFKILIDNKNNVVTRVELMEFVWKEVVVSDESVTKAASDLRKFFATNNITDFKLITISKLGYKLEIIESNQRKTNFIKYLIRTIGYVILVFLLTILIIRAVKY
ncbi:MAG: hypothetical protein GY931_13765 [Maribacter sp.]|nr:hypothetical protein [Maribacter sp.]